MWDSRYTYCYLRYLPGGRLLLRRAGVHDLQVRRGLRLHHGDLRALPGLHAAVDRVHDRAPLLAGDRLPHVQSLHPQTLLPRVPATGRERPAARRLLHM